MKKNMTTLGLALGIAVALAGTASAQVLSLIHI